MIFGASVFTCARHHHQPPAIRYQYGRMRSLSKRGLLLCTALLEVRGRLHGKKSCNRHVPGDYAVLYFQAQYSRFQSLPIILRTYASLLGTVLHRTDEPTSIWTWICGMPRGHLTFWDN